MVEFYHTKNIPNKIPLGTTMPEGQGDICATIKFDGKRKIVMVFAPQSTGKCQTKGSKVLMANGKWNNIENLKVGDKVISPSVDGKKSTIAKVADTDNFYSDKSFELWTERESKGNETLLYSCSPNHIIPLNYLKDNRKYVKGKRINIKSSEEHPLRMAGELYSFSKDRSFDRYLCTTQGAFISKFENGARPIIDPYSLGVFLGDGSFTGSVSSSVYKRGVKSGTGSSKIIKSNYKNLTITSNNPEIIENLHSSYKVMCKIKRSGTTVLTYAFALSGVFSKQLHHFGLYNKRSGTKFIPEPCKYADYKYRLKLLEGLIDTDGFVDRRGIIEIALKSKKLIDDIVFIVRSLGGRAKTRQISKKCTTTGAVGTYYCTGIHLGKFHKTLDLKYKFKKDRLKYYVGNKRNHQRRSFYLKKGKGGQVYGITLDNKNQLYVTDNFMVTHNSSFAFGIPEESYLRFGVSWFLIDPSKEFTSHKKALKNKYRHQFGEHDPEYFGSPRPLDFKIVCPHTVKDSVEHYDYLVSLKLSDFFSLKDKDLREKMLTYLFEMGGTSFGAARRQLAKVIKKVEGRAEKYQTFDIMRRMCEDDLTDRREGMRGSFVLVDKIESLILSQKVDKENTISCRDVVSLMKEGGFVVFQTSMSGASIIEFQVMVALIVQMLIEERAEFNGIGILIDEVDKYCPRVGGKSIMKEIITDIPLKYGKFNIWLVGIAQKSELTDASLTDQANNILASNLTPDQMRDLVQETKVGFSVRERMENLRAGIVPNMEWMNIEPFETEIVNGKLVTKVREFYPRVTRSQFHER